jgi:hypothetical protein
MRGAIFTLPNTPSWRGAQLKNSTGITLCASLLRHEPVMSDYAIGLQYKKKIWEAMYREEKLDYLTL